jgi:sugar O-acyltransferase (sialic acid O-acetyltransferase NeuD family)
MIYILGAGGMGREALNVYLDLGRGHEVVGFLEDNCKNPGKFINDKPVLDTQILNELDRNKIKLICGIGTPLRKSLIEKTKKLDYTYDTLIHPSIIRSQWVTIEEGAIICAGTILTNQIKVGLHSIVNIACTISHDVSIGSYTTISPGTHIAGKVSIGDECFIGIGVSIIDGIHIGDRSYIGAGAVVTHDIPSDVLVVGVPARVIKNIDIEHWHNII